MRNATAMEDQSVLHFRALPALIAAAVALIAALLLVSLPEKAEANLLCSHTKMNVVAHEDDDIIFQSPDLLEAIAAGDCVRTVFVTAGDAGRGEAYWREREEGPRAAYAVMAGAPNSWTKSEATIAGHTVHIATLTGKPTVSQVYLRLPNGGPSGSGYAATGFKSLPKLWRSKNPEPASLTPISELTALDGSATYTYEGLLATLQGLIAEFEPEVISTQNFNVEFGAGDHADHIATAKMTRFAANSWTGEHVLRSYMDYETQNSPINVFEPQLAKKLNAYYAYAAHDSNEACTSQVQCEEPFYSDYWAWLKRQIVASESSVPGADAGPDQAVESKAAVTLDGSGSSDPLGHTLSYEWKQTAGTAVTLSNSKAVKPTFTAPTGPASLTFSLTVKSSEASSQADSVTVSVAAPKFALKVTASGNGTGTVTSSPAGVNCGADCEESYEQGTKVTLTPTPGANSEFKGWSGACSGSGACEVTMSAAKSVGAEFVLVKRQLTLSKAGSGSGTVTSSPAGVECGSTCAASYDHGTLVKLTGTPTAGSKAVTWSGCDAVNGSNQCEVTMSAAKAVTATFNLEQHQLTVSKSGTGSGTVTSSPAGISCGATCAAGFDHGTEVTLSASPAAGSEFKGWSGACTGTGTCKVTMSAAKAVTAEFAPVPKFALKASRSGNGTGTVTSSPAGIECGADCEEPYEQGTKVTLTQTPGANSEFKGWSGACSGTGACEVTMSAAKAAGAEFVLVKRQLTVSKNGSGTGTVTSSPAGIECGATCSASFDHGTVVKLSGTPGANSKAVVWESCPGTVNASNQCEVAMSAVKAVTATFDLEQRQLTVAKSGSGSGTINSSPAGINCGSECSASFPHGTLVKLTGAAGSNTKAVVWESCPGTVNGSNQCEVTMSAAKEAKARFDLEQRQLTVAKSGSGTGTVTSSPAGIECGATCAANFDHGTVVKLTGAPGLNTKAVVWQTCPGTVNGSNQCEVTMGAAKEAVATFSLEQRQLTVERKGTGSGTVTSSPAGIECGSTCAASYDHGTLVKLTGTPTAGSKAVTWSGCDAVNGSNQCEVTMGAAKAVTATFSLEPHQLAVSKPGTGSGTVTSSPAGIECGATCSASFLHGTVVKLTGAPGANTKAVVWESCPGTVNASNQCEVTMGAAKEAKATFDLEQRQLTVTKNGSGSGTVTSFPAGINCGSTCAAGFDHGTLVTLAGAPGLNTKAVVWQTCPGTVNASNQCEVTMTAAKEAVATFDLEQRQLTVTKNGSGSGTVTSSPGGIECGVTCAAGFDHGTLVKLTGTPTAGSKAVTWSGCDAVNGSNQCEVTMSAAKAVTATFSLEPHQLTVSKPGTGSGTVTSSPAGISCGGECAANFLHGTKVTLTGTPTEGSKAVIWESCPGTVNGSNQCEVTVDAAKNARARFDLEGHLLSIERDGSGSGTVTTSPAGVDCGSECAASFLHGTEVTLTGTPTAGSKAVVWDGCDAVNGSNECEVTMTAAKSVTATFDLESHLLSVGKNGNGSGTVTSAPAGINCGSECAAGYDHGTLVKLTGTPVGGSKAVVWQTCPGTVNGSNQCEVTMSAAKEAVATFSLEQHQLSVADNGSGTGTVTSSPAGIECGAKCQASFDHGTLVTLTGNPGAHSKAVAWESCPGTVNGSNQCEVTMNTAKEARAAFDLESHSLRIEAKGTGSGTVTSAPAGISCSECQADFVHGTIVKLSGTPAAGSKPVVWSGCDAIVGANECEVTMTEAKAVSAEFDPIGTFALKVKKAGNGAGTIVSSPGGIECGASCQAVFSEDTKVKLASSSAAGSKAVEWSGCDAVVGGECEVTMGADKEVTATYILETRNLKIVKSGSGSGTITSSPAGIECGAGCEADFDYGTEVTLTAVPDTGTEAVAWSGCDEVVGGDKCKVSTETDREVSATLEREPDPPVTNPTSPPAPEQPSTPSIKLLKAKVEHKRGTARFVFAARGSASGFRCALARVRHKLKYKRCTSPATYRNLEPGRYVFKVKAIGPDGADTTPATRRFKVRQRT